MLPFNDHLHGNLITERLESQLLKANPLVDPSQRHLPIYLPPGYHQNNEHFPLVLGLSGLFGNYASWLSFGAFSENLVELLDRLIQEKELPPFVLALPDCFTRFGGSQYIDSAGTGLYSQHVALELLPFLRSNYRVSASREDTVVAGKSSGGFGALRLAMTWPDLFAHVAVSAADLYFDMSVRHELAGFPSALERLGGLPAFLSKMNNLRKLGSDEARALNIIALSACYSPSEIPPGFELPMDLRSGELRPEVFERWLLEDPVERISISRNLSTRSQELAALGGLKTLHVEAGNRDEYAADLGAKVFASRCSEAGIDLMPQSFDGGHFGTTWRWEHMLKAVFA
jgi:enterochelin esterase-like enzyme